MKGASLFATALLIAGCSHDAWNQSNDAALQLAEEYSNNFKNIVLGGQDVDSRQTWNTAVSTQITLTSAKTGTLKIYATDPAQGSTVAALYTGAISQGETKTFSVARPQDATTLYATILDDNSYMIDIMAFDASEAQVTTAFYTTPANARQAAHRAISSIFNFAEKAPTPAASDYAESVPAGVTYLGDLRDPWNGYQLYHFNIPNNTAWLDAAAVANCGMKFDRYNGYTIYVKGTVNSTDLYLTQNSTLYLIKGAKLTLQGTDYSFGQNNVKIYVADGAELVCNGKLEISTSKLYNNGIVRANQLQISNTGVVYNSSKGTLKISTNINIGNSNSVMVNDGSIEAVNINTAGSSHMQNNGNVTLSGETIINSNNNTWVNNGQYTTNYFYYTAGSCDVINNCKLTVRELFKINLGDTDKNGFKLDGGVVTKNFEAAGPSYIFMTAQSVFEVTNIATMNITKDVYGIYGPETGKQAVFHAKKIVNGAADANQGFVANYFGQLIVAYDESHFKQGYSDKSAAQQAAGEVGAQPYYHVGDGAIVEQTQYVNYTVESGTCNPGFNGGGGKKEEPKQYVYFAFEDLGTSDDFDFNDVVVRVGMPDDNNMSTVELCAIGGSLQQKVFCDNTQIGKEVHEYGEFGTNTYSVSSVPIATLGSVTVPAGTSVASLNINIQVTRKDGQVVTVSGPQAGEVPFRVVVSGDDEGKWFWPRERVNISDAYTQFGQWGANMDSNPNWYKTPVSKKVIKW